MRGFSRFTAERDGEFATFFIVMGAVVLGTVFGNAAVSATRGAVAPFRYYIPPLPLWYRTLFAAIGLFGAAGAPNVAFRVAAVIFAISQALRVSMLGLSVDLAIIAGFLISAGITLQAPGSRRTRRPWLLIIAVVVASTLLVFAVQTYSIRVFERRREAIRPKPVAVIDQINSTVGAIGQAEWRC